MTIKPFFFAAALMAAISCTKAESAPPAPENADYLGKMTVEYKGQAYSTEGVTVKFVPSEDAKTATLTIYKVKFVPQMPVSIDVTIPDVGMEVTEGGATLSCDNIVPLALGGEMPEYTVKGFTGQVSGDALSFSLDFGGFPTSFSGKK